MLRSVLAIAAAVRLAGYHGATTFTQFAALLTLDQLATVDSFFSPSRKRYTPRP